VFLVRYELSFYMLFRINSVFKGLNKLTGRPRRRWEDNTKMDLN
jgi:hypothetical protein